MSKEVTRCKETLYSKYIKRLIDFVCSLLALIILSPVYLILWILVKAKLGSPVLFCQKRPGKDGKIFIMYKFRTMTNEVDEKGELLPDSERLTKFGKLLRSTSLDELPELINVFRGDMSIVGPRPLLVEYLPLYNELQKHRHDVKPGITGYAQVNGRNTLGWDEKFKLDVWYTQNISFWLDVKILFDTIRIVFKREGISSESSVTMEKFTGSPDETKSLENSDE